VISWVKNTLLLCPDTDTWPSVQEVPGTSQQQKNGRLPPKNGIPCKSGADPPP